MTLIAASEGKAVNGGAIDSLMRISCLANKSLDLDDVLPKTLAGIAELIGADRLTVLQDQSGLVSVRAVWSGSNSETVSWEHVYSRTEFPLLCPSETIAYDGERSNGPSIRELFPYAGDEERIRALLLPLAIEDFVIGRLDIVRCAGRGPFSSEESRLAEACARIIGLAVRNGMEYARVAWLADHDPLTGLGNRRAFDTALRNEIARAERYGRALSLLLIDLDDFKDANTKLGLSGGDEVLCKIAAILERGARHGVDVPCRIGGDEFAVILPESSELSANDLAQRLMKEVVAATELVWPVRFSYSIATFPVVSAEDLRRSADVRLKDAKSRKRHLSGTGQGIIQ